MPLQDGLVSQETSAMASLQSAIDRGCFHTACLLMDRGVDLDYQDSTGQTALMRCAYLSDRHWAWRIFTDLLGRGAKTSLRDAQGRDVLFHAVAKGRCKMTFTLMENPTVSVNERNSGGKTVLHIAAAKGFCAIVRTLLAFVLKYELDVDAVDPAGMTALMLACQYGRLRTARILVNQGFASLTRRDDVHFRNARGWLATTYVIPPEVNPFNEDVILRRVEEIKGGKRQGATGSARIVSRKTLAQSPRPSPSGLVGSDSRGSLSTLSSSTELSSMSNISDDRPRHTTPILQEMFILYALHTSDAYLPSAKTPEAEDETETEQDVSSEKGDKRSAERLTSKGRLQRMHTYRRTESAILQRLKSAGRKATPSPENVAIPFRRTLKSEAVGSQRDGVSPAGRKQKHASEPIGSKPGFVPLDNTSDSLCISGEIAYEVASDDVSTPSPGAFHKSSGYFFGSSSVSVDHDEVFSEERSYFE